MIISEVMAKNPATVNPEASVIEAKRIMADKGVSKLPVVDKSGALVGIVTDNDIQKAAPSEATTLDMFELSYLISKLTVEKVMKKDVKFVSEDESVEEAASLMADYKISCLPVIKNGLVVGIITETDLFRILIDMLRKKIYE